MHKPLDIALLVKTDADWNRNILMGAAQYSADFGGWNLTVPPADNNGEVFLPDNWNGDGIICRITSEPLETSVISKGIPAVNISWLNCATSKIPRVNSDEKGCAKLAARFLKEKQFDHFAYIGFPPWKNYSDRFEETFAEHLGKRGQKLHKFKLTSQRSSHGIDDASLSQWVQQLPKPVAIAVWDSIVGQILVKNCLAKQIKIPHSVAILCIEHDPLWSALAPIPISNIDQDPWRVGYTAAKVLHHMIKGGDTPKQPVLIDPLSIVQRKSTEASAVKDPILDKAIKYIYGNSKHGITVKDLLDHTGISRRALETKFKHELDCSPAVFIRRIQLQAVAKLLRTTKLTIASIANQTGFAYPEVLMRAFKREFGITPMQFRGAGPAETIGRSSNDETLRISTGK